MPLHHKGFGRRRTGCLTVGLAMVLAGQAFGQVTIATNHPRLLFRPDGTPGFRTMAELQAQYYAGDEHFTSYMGSVFQQSGTPFAEAAKYAVTGVENFATNAVSALVSGSLSYVGSEGGSAAGPEWALAYDWMYTRLSSSQRSSVETKLRSWAQSCLNDLNGGGPSEWHGRVQLACQGWIVSLALPHNNSGDTSTRNAFWNQWQDALRAIDISEGWPEGPTYWANNRAVWFPMAYEAYTTAVVSNPAFQVADPMRPIRMLGLWQMYTDRGDNSMERYGDVASAVSWGGNGTFTHAFDYYARITRDPLLATYIELTRKVRTQPSSYYDMSYASRYVYAYDPYVPKPEGFSYDDPAATLNAHAPKAMLFGPDGLGLVVMRTGWGTGHTSISYKAGDYLAHHGHYDQGTFTIFKYAPLVINSGGYGSYTDKHRLNYYVRTVAKNAILVQRPDESWTPSGVAPPGGYANDAGQRIVNATGSTVTSVDNWLANKNAGWHYDLADINAFEHFDGQYTYVDSDITKSYNSTLWDSEGQGGKVSRVTRQLFWLPGPEALAVFDRVTSTNANYKKKWLLHTPGKPAGGTESVRLGSAADGLMVVDGATVPGNTLVSVNGNGKLFHQVLLPAAFEVNKVGGPNYRYYVETDANDDNGYNGANQVAGYTTPQWYHDYGDWRVEVSPKTRQATDTFLNVLRPRHVSVAAVEAAQQLPADPVATVLRVGDEVAGFGTTGLITAAFSYSLDAAGPTTHRLADLTPAQAYYVLTGYGDVQLVQASAKGVLVFVDPVAGPHAVTVSTERLYLPADTDRNGEVDIFDVITVIQAFGTAAGDPTFDPAADIDGNSSVDIFDVIIVVENFGRTSP